MQADRVKPSWKAGRNYLAFAINAEDRGDLAEARRMGNIALQHFRFAPVVVPEDVAHQSDLLRRANHLATLEA